MTSPDFVTAVAAVVAPYVVGPAGRTSSTNSASSASDVALHVAIPGVGLHQQTLRGWIGFCRSVLCKLVRPSFDDIARLCNCCGGCRGPVRCRPSRSNFIYKLCELGFCRPVLHELRRPSFSDINRLCGCPCGCHGPVLCSPRRPSVVELCRGPAHCELRRPSFTDVNRLCYRCGVCRGLVAVPGGRASSISASSDFVVAVYFAISGGRASPTSFAPVVPSSFR